MRGQEALSMAISAVVSAVRVQFLQLLLGRRAWRERRATRDRVLPSGVFGPLLLPPCNLHRPPLPLPGALHGVPFLVFAPQTGFDFLAPSPRYPMSRVRAFLGDSPGSRERSSPKIAKDFDGKMCDVGQHHRPQASFSLTRLRLDGNDISEGRVPNLGTSAHSYCPT